MDEKAPLPRNATTTTPSSQPNGKYDYYSDYVYDPVPSYHETYQDYDYHAKSPINLHLQPTTPHDYLPSEENDHDLRLVGGGGVGRGRRDGLGGRGGAAGTVGGGGGGRIDNGRRMNEEMRELTQQDGRGGGGGGGGGEGGGGGGGGGGNEGEEEGLEGPKRWFSLVILLLVLLVVIFVVVAIVILYLNYEWKSAIESRS